MYFSLYHLELNPVEIIWADVKSCIMWHNITFTLQGVWNLYEKKLSKCTHAKLTYDECLPKGPINDAVTHISTQNRKQ